MAIDLLPVTSSCVSFMIFSSVVVRTLSTHFLSRWLGGMT